MTTTSEKPAVLLVHGMWCTEKTLYELQGFFQTQGYAVEALRLPYHVPKAKHSAETLQRLGRATLQEYTAHVVERIQSQARPPIVVGHSMGALIAQLAAAQVPCERLILLSSAAPAGIMGLGLSVFRTLGRNLLRFPLWTSTTELSLANVAYGVANAQTPELQREITEGCTYESGMSTFQISVSLLLGRKSAAFVDTSSIRCPVLLLGGTQDRITPIGIQRAIARRFGKQCHFVEIEGCCHWTVGGRFFPQVREAIAGWLAE